MAVVNAGLSDCSYDFCTFVFWDYREWLERSIIDDGIISLARGVNLIGNIVGNIICGIPIQRLLETSLARVSSKPRGEYKASG